NNLGQYLAMGVPFVALIPRRSHRWWFMGLTLFAIIWSASRSSFAAMGMLLIAILVLKTFRQESRRVVGPIVAMAPWVLVVLLPFITKNPEEYTNRGLIWKISLQYWHTNVWYGLGANFYQVIGHTSARQAATVFHGHNQ